MVNPAAWVVHKFGGSSVADADCFRKVAAILEAALLRVVALAERQDERVRDEIAQLRERHFAIADELLSAEAARAYRAAFDKDWRDLEQMMRALHLPHALHNSRPSARALADLVAGYGEVWSTRLFRPFFESRAKRPGPVAWLDARRVVVVEWGRWDRVCSGRNHAPIWVRRYRNNSTAR
jgi:aspartokinase/homoserine dehydrogenase 1